MSASTRWLAAVGGVIAAAVLVSVIALALTSGEQEFPAGSPEDAVQRYLRAVDDRDATTAFEFFSAQLAADCAPLPRDSITYRGDQRVRATLVRTVERAEHVEVEVRITENYGGGLFDSGYSWTTTFVLIQEDGDWRFSEMPWPLYCSRPYPASTSPEVPAPAETAPSSTGARS